MDKQNISNICQCQPIKEKQVIQAPVKDLLYSSDCVLFYVAWCIQTAII